MNLCAKSNHMAGLGTVLGDSICQTEGVYEAMFVLFYGYGAKI
jgi:hypothetical protein